MPFDKRILMIVNEFPPVGESGVQRPLKFLKYLDRAGWKTFVITPSKPSKNVLDHQLLKEIPKQTKVYRTTSWGLGGSSLDKVAELKHEQSQSVIHTIKKKLLLNLNHLLFPLDKQIGWVPFAFIQAMLLIRKHRLKNVYITAFPFSAFIVGILLKIVYGRKITWIADYRDGWQFEPLIETRIPKFRHTIIRHWDRLTLQKCDKAIFVTQPICDQYLEAYPWLRNKAFVIPNGYDEDDFADLQPLTFDTSSIVYMGKLYHTDRQNIIPLLNVLKDNELHIPVLHLGTVSPDSRKAVAECGYVHFRHLGYKSHHEALCHGLGAAINLLLLNDDPETEVIYTGKLFELLRLGKPILVLGPPKGIVKDLIESSKAGEYVHLQNEQGILKAIENLLKAPENYPGNSEILKNFNRKTHSEMLAKLYE